MIAVHVARRDLRATLGSPGFWVLASAWLAVQGLLFSALLASFLRMDQRGLDPSGVPLVAGFIDPLFSTTALFVVLLTPLLSMRALAGEQHGATLPLLLSAPGSPLGIVLGKWLSTVTLLALLVLATALVPALVLCRFGDPPLGPSLSALGGLLALCGCTAAVGLAASAGSGSQLLAAALAFCVLMGSWMLGAFEHGEGALPFLAAHGSLLVRVRGFGQGLVHSTDLVWLLGVTALGLVIAWQRLEARRWQ